MFSRTGTRNLWFFSLSDALSRFGGQFQFLAVITLIYTVTGSPLLTALQMTTGSLPVILLARRAGAVADRYDPRRTIAVVNVLQGIATLGFLLVENVWFYLALNLLVTGIGVFQLPARSALLPQMVGRERILQANARLATVRGAVQLVAPGLAGSLVILTGPRVAFLANALCYLAPALAMAVVSPVEQVKLQPADEAGKQDLAWAFLKSRPDLVLMLLAFGAYEIGMWAVNALFVPYTTEVLQSGAEIVGWSTSFYFGVGFLTGLALERYGHALKSPRLLYLSYLCGALVWAGYTLTHSVPVALLLSAFDGLVYTYAWTLFESRIQEEAPAEVRGRVFGLARTGDELCSTTGQLGGGWAAAAGGLLAGMRGFSGLTVLLLGLVGLSGRLVGRRSTSVQQ